MVLAVPEGAGFAVGGSVPLLCLLRDASQRPFDLYTALQGAGFWPAPNKQTSCGQEHGCISGPNRVRKKMVILY